MKRAVHETWPPLIIATDKPRWVTWRDFALTLMMWIGFALMLETEFELFFGRYLEQLGLGDFQTEAHWDVFFQHPCPGGIFTWHSRALRASHCATVFRLSE